MTSSRNKFFIVLLVSILSSYFSTLTPYTFGTFGKKWFSSKASYVTYSLLCDGLLLKMAFSSFKELRRDSRYIKELDVLKEEFLQKFKNCVTEEKLELFLESNYCLSKDERKKIKDFAKKIDKTDLLLSVKNYSKKMSRLNSSYRLNATFTMLKAFFFGMHLYLCFDDLKRNGWKRDEDYHIALEVVFWSCLVALYAFEVVYL